MKPKDFSGIFKILKKKRTLLMQADRNIDQEIRQEADNRHGDDMDRAEADYEQEVSFLLKSKTQNEIRHIDEALNRIKKKEYGLCAECGEDIPKKRLQIQPYTIHCVECQEELETSQGVYRNS